MVERNLIDWLQRHTANAPSALRDRVFSHAGRIEAQGSVPELLARASRHALNRVAAEPEGGRPIALDLLAADALITLALLAQAQTAPAELETFASSLLREPVRAA